MRKSNAFAGIIAILLATFAFVFAGCTTHLADGTDEGSRAVTDGLPYGVLSVENGYATLSVNAYNKAVDLMTRSILPSIGNQIYFTIVASTRMYGVDALDDSKSTEAAYIAHTTYDGHANYAADFAVLDGSTFADANGDNYPDGMDLAKPFFNTATGIPTAQTFTLKTNTQWYFTAYGTATAPYTLAKGIGSETYKVPNNATAEQFNNCIVGWGWEEWTQLVARIQAEAKIVGDLPLYILDDGDASVAGGDQIQLLKQSDGTPYPAGLTIETDTQGNKPGHFLVPIKVPAEVTGVKTIKYVTIAWEPLAGQNPLPDGGFIKWDRTILNMDQSIAFYPEADEGNYEVSINFYNEDPGNDPSDPSYPAAEPIYEIHEDTLTVWGNVDSTILNTTGDTGENWYGSVTVTAGNILRLDGSPDTTQPSNLTNMGYVITPKDVQQFKRTRFYVSNGAGSALKKANGTETGSIFAPYDTIGEAVAIIEADADLRSTVWYIVVDGTPADTGTVTVTNKKLTGGESGDYQLIIQSYKPKSRTTLTKGLDFKNQNTAADPKVNASDSALRVVLRNIDITANVNIGTEDLVLDNATINATGTNNTVLMAQVTDTNQNGILNVALSDTTSVVKNITSTIKDPAQVTVLRSYTIDYDTPTIEPALKNPFNNSGTADKTTYLTATNDITTRFVLDDEYSDVDVAGNTVIGVRVLSENTTNNDRFEGCLTIKSPQELNVTFGKGLYATDVLTAAGLTYGTVGNESGWIVTPTSYSSTDIEAAKAGATIPLTLTIKIDSLSPQNAPANDVSVSSEIVGSFKASIKDGSDKTADFGDSGTAPQYITKPGSFADSPAATDTTSYLEFGITLQGDYGDPDLDAYSVILYISYELNGLKYSSPYKLIIKNAD